MSLENNVATIGGMLRVGRAVDFQLPDVKSFSANLALPKFSSLRNESVQPLMTYVVEPWNFTITSSGEANTGIADSQLEPLRLFSINTVFDEQERPRLRYCAARNLDALEINVQRSMRAQLPLPNSGLLERAENGALKIKNEHVTLINQWPAEAPDTMCVYWTARFPDDAIWSGDRRRLLSLEHENLPLDFEDLTICTTGSDKRAVLICYQEIEIPVGLVRPKARNTIAVQIVGSRSMAPILNVYVNQSVFVKNVPLVDHSKTSGLGGRVRFHAASLMTTPAIEYEVHDFAICMPNANEPLDRGPYIMHLANAESVAKIFEKRAIVLSKVDAERRRIISTSADLHPPVYFVATPSSPALAANEQTLEPLLLPGTEMRLVAIGRNNFRVQVHFKIKILQEAANTRLLFVKDLLLLRVRDRKLMASVEDGWQQNALVVDLPESRVVDLALNYYRVPNRSVDNTRNASFLCLSVIDKSLLIPLPAAAPGGDDNVESDDFISIFNDTGSPGEIRVREINIEAF
jgi:hypothetical protein